MGSLRNPEVPKVAERLREIGWDAFDDWYAAGEKADDAWQAYETGRGRNFEEALDGYAANHVFSYDKHHLDRCSAGVLVLPAGKSGHLELGYLIGCGKPSYILYNQMPDRFDVMYKLATRVFRYTDELIEHLTKEFNGNVSRR